MNRTERRASGRASLLRLSSSSSSSRLPARARHCLVPAAAHNSGNAALALGRRHLRILYRGQLAVHGDGVELEVERLAVAQHQPIRRRKIMKASSVCHRLVLSSRKRTMRSWFWMLAPWRPTWSLASLKSPHSDKSCGFTTCDEM